MKMYSESLIGTNSESLMETFRITDEEKKNRFVKKKSCFYKRRRNFVFKKYDLLLESKFHYGNLPEI